MKKKLKLKDLKVQSFITQAERDSINTAHVKGGGWTGNCGSAIGVTCPDPACDFQSIPLDECFGTITVCGDSIVCESAAVNPCGPELA